MSDKIVLVKIKGNNGEMNKMIDQHDFPEDGITHFVLSSTNTKDLDGSYQADISIVDKQE